MRKRLRGMWFMTATSFRAAPWLATGTFGLTAIGSMLIPVGFWATKLLVDALARREASDVGRAILLLAVTRVTTQVAVNFGMTTFRMNMEDRTRLYIDTTMLRLGAGIPGLEHFERRDFADEMALLRSQSGSLAQPAGPLVFLLQVVLSGVGTMALLVSLHPALLLVPLFGIPGVVFGARAAAINQRNQDAVIERMRLGTLLFGLGTGAVPGKEVRIFGLAPELRHRLANLQTEVLGETTRERLKGAALMAGGSAIFALAYVGAIALVGRQALQGKATAGDVVLAVTATSTISSVVSSAVSNANWLGGTLKTINRFLWLIDYEAEARRPVDDPASVPDGIREGIAVEGLSFTYPGTEAPVLEDVNLFLPAGSTVAIVGDNGAGKTTLVKLLCRFYEPTAGHIAVDGVDIARFDHDEWRSRIAAGFQDFAAFELTSCKVSAGNCVAGTERVVSYGHPDATHLTVTGPVSGATTTYTLDAAGRITEAVDPDRVLVVRNHYHPTTGRVEVQERPVPRTTPETERVEPTSFVYDLWNRTATLSRPWLDRTTTPNPTPTTVEVTYGWDSQLRQTSILDPTNHDIDTTFDGGQGPASFTDRRGVTTTRSYNSAGQPTSSNEPGDVSTSALYDNARLTSFTDGEDKTTSLAYDPGIRVPKTIVDREGKTTSILSGPSALRPDLLKGQVGQVTDPDGVVTKSFYNADRSLQRTEDAAGNQTTYTYDDFGNLDTVTTPSNRDGSATGVVTDYGFDAARRQRSIKVGGDPASSTTYTLGGRVDVVTDPAGRRMDHDYDLPALPSHPPATGWLSQVTDEADKVTSFVYDDDGNVIETRRPGNTAETFATTYAVFDKLGRVVRETDPTGVVTNSAYNDGDGNLTESWIGTEAPTSYLYDDRGRLEKLTDPVGRITLTAYDRDDRVASTLLKASAAEAEADGELTSFCYDAEGRLTLTLDPRHPRTSAARDCATAEGVADAVVAKRTYTDGGRLKTETDADGVTTTYGYDFSEPTVPDLGHLHSVAEPATDDHGPATTTFTWWSDGSARRRTLPSGLYAETTWDAQGRRATETDLAGTTTSFEYTARGELKKVKTPKVGGGTVERVFGYDLRPGLMTSSTDALARTTAMVYDGRGNLKSRTTARPGASARTETFAWDLADRPGDSTDLSGKTTTRLYYHQSGEDTGRLKSVTDPTGRSQTLVYDDAGQVSTRTYAKSGSPSEVVTSTWDRAGRLKTLSDPAAAHAGTTSWDYDPAGNPTKLNRPGLDADLDWHWTKAGRRDTVTHDGAITTYAWHADGRLKSASLPGLGTAVYVWTLDGRPDLATVTPSTGPVRTRDWGWDHDRLDTYTEASDGGAVHLLQDLDYDVAGRVKQLDTTTGGRGGTLTSRGLPTRRTSYSYDAAGQLTSQALGPVSGALTATEWTYDEAGNRTSESRKRGATTLGSTTFTWGPDGSGNRGDLLVSANVSIPGESSSVTNYTYDDAGRLSGLSTHGQSDAFAYDTRGRLASHAQSRGKRGSWTMARAWDGDELASVTTSGSSISSTQVVWDPTSQIAQPVALTKDGTPTTELLYGLEREAAAGKGAFAQDWMGTALATKATSSITRAIGADAWGRASGTSAKPAMALSPGPEALAAGSHEVAFGYRGELVIGDLVHLRARDYAPSLGLFTSRDPIDGGLTGEPTFGNDFAYGANDPIGKIDPLGLSPLNDDDFVLASALPIAVCSAKRIPPAPERPASDPGAGRWGSEPLHKRADDVAFKPFASALVEVADLKGFDNAARHLSHYLANSGSDLHVNPDDIADDAPGFRILIELLARKKATGLAKQLTAEKRFNCPVSFEQGWRTYAGTKLASESQDWFYAVGDFRYAVTGVVVLESNAKVDVRFRSHIHDRYNWDDGKQTPVGPFNVRDEDMGGLHKAGLAREYDIVGTSGVHHFRCGGGSCGPTIADDPGGGGSR